MQHPVFLRSFFLFYTPRESTENSRTNVETSESSAEHHHYGIEMRDCASMTDDLTSGGPTNHLSHSPHHNQKASSGVPNGQATFIGRRPSVRSKLKVAPDLHGKSLVYFYLR